MKRQEGYIELDGEAVSVAAKKAYAVAEKHDAEVNEKINKREKEEQEKQEYLLSDVAVEDVKAVRSQALVKETVTKTEQGWFFTYKFDKEIEFTEKFKLIDLLRERNSAWGGFNFRDPGYNYKDIKDLTDEEIKHLLRYSVCYSLGFAYWRFSSSNTAHYYKQFFDLNGKVLLTLEQYSILKEYM